MDEIQELEETLGFRFRDRSLITRALTHRSYLNENRRLTLEDNERLEFLGDAVLDFVVGTQLYHSFPEMREGELTSLRAALVRTSTLARFAREWELGHYLRLGYGEEENGGRSRAGTLCATFEAVIGAVYLDQGLDTVFRLVESFVEPALIRIMDNSLHKDPKSEFQVWAQAEFNITPTYRVIFTSGPDHAKSFTSQVLVGDEIWGEGSGRSKQLAAQEAAAAAMNKVAQLENSEKTPTEINPTP